MAGIDYILAQDLHGKAVFDAIAPYIVCDGPTLAEASDDIIYYLALMPAGQWCIRKRTISAGTERFARGDSDYLTAWANKTSLTYDRIPEVF